MGPVWGEAPTVRRRQSGLQAELVALRVGHHDELVVPRDDGGAEAHQPVALGLEVCWGAEVEVLSVLGDLRLGHPLEPEARATPPRGLDPGAVRGAVLVDVRAEGARPERGDPQRVPAVERHRLHEGGHGSTVRGSFPVPWGADVVLDFSFWSRRMRDDYREVLAPTGVVPETIYLATDRDTVLRRMRARAGTHSDDFVLPEDLVVQYVDHFEPPTPDEGPLTVVR
jgi:hypothetical protein